MSRLARTIFIVLCTVAGTNSTDSSDTKSRFQYLGNKHASDFYNFGAGTVRVITLLIEFTSLNPDMEIKLETNEELAETIKRVTLPIWLKVSGKRDFRNPRIKIGSYSYQRKGGADINRGSYNLYVDRDSPFGFGPIMMNDPVYELKIFVQPSHVLFVTNSSSLSRSYGDFEKKDDIDAIFDSIHVEGDLIVHKFTVRTGGALTNPADIPSHVRTFPYRNRIVRDMEVRPSSESEQIFEYYGTPQFFEGEWEIVILGKLGIKPTKFELLYGDVVILTILNFFPYSNGEFAVRSGPQKKEGNKDDYFTKYEVKDQTMEDVFTKQGIKDRTMDDYFRKYGVNPFHRNADFDLSIHHMSGEKAGLIQVTVRSNSRIASYYVETKTMVTNSIKFKINQDKVEVEVYQAVLTI